MKILNNPTELNNAINKELYDFLKEDLKDYVFEVEKRMIYDYVYSYEASDWAMSKRRYENGGLADIDNMEAIEVLDNNAIIYVNNTESQDGIESTNSLTEAEAIETGDSDWNQPYERPFTKETLEYIKNSKDTYNVLKGFFNKKGIEIKQIK